MITIKDVPHDGFPGNVLFITASGEVTAKDYETVLIPAVEEKLKTFDKIRMLYQLDEGFDSYTAGAMWDDTKLGFQHFTAWEKIAVVTDVNWMRNAVAIFSLAMPADVKVFSNVELVQAQDWLKQ